ncbi:phosphonoacetaldehyde reductase [Olivibacter ginsenosidimutans]|uniref:Phosphonoacetaldehyde reductase n=1 Tax=Olivibacter ginsenosidimutans TaxID=1176537 RepID=A0ABP9AK29_9SPHI
MTKVYIGRGALNALVSILTEVKPQRILLVTGKSSYDQHPLRGLLEQQLQGFQVQRHSEFQVNPTLDDLVHGAQVKQAFAPHLIIGIGGGSVLDTAKLLKVLPTEEQAIVETISSERAIQENNAPLILLPTTAGSGSEATHFAVAYMGKKKYSVASPYLLPNYTLVDAALTDSMPAYLTAVSGFDALAQAIESYWNIKATKESLAYATESISLILPHLEKVVLTPCPASRDALSKAAYLAGKAINITKTTAPHALSYGFTLNYGIPHGHAVMLTLPALLRHQSTDAIAVLHTVSPKHYNERMLKLYHLFGKANGAEVADYLEKLMDKLGLQRRLQDFAIPLDDLSMLVAHVNVERLNNHPVRLTPKDLMQILEAIY